MDNIPKVILMQKRVDDISCSGAILSISDRLIHPSTEETCHFSHSSQVGHFLSTTIPPLSTTVSPELMSGARGVPSPPSDAAGAGALIRADGAGACPILLRRGVVRSASPLPSSITISHNLRYFTSAKWKLENFAICLHGRFRDWGFSCSAARRFFPTACYFHTWFHL